MEMQRESMLSKAALQGFIASWEEEEIGGFAL